MLDMSYFDTVKETKEFTDKFWEWFDGLPKQDKKRFWDYKEDMAKFFFFNKHFKHNYVPSFTINTSTNNQVILVR